MGNVPIRGGGGGGDGGGGGGVCVCVCVYVCVWGEGGGVDSSISIGSTMMLTLCVLNFADGTKTYIYILCHYSTLTRHEPLKYFIK